MASGRRATRLGALLLAACLLAGLFPVSVEAFVARLPLRQTNRWSAEPYRGTGLHDGIQVGVQSGIADLLGLGPADTARLEQAVADAFAAWESGALHFDVAFGAPVERGNLPGSGFEIDVFALPGDDPIFTDRESFSQTAFSVDFVEDRLLSNGQRIGGWVIVGGDIFLNVHAIRRLWDDLGLSPDERVAAFQRLLMRGIGRVLGLGDPSTSTDQNLAALVPIDLCDVERTVRLSQSIDPEAVMSSESAIPPTLFVTALSPDDLAGRDLLYPPLPPGVACGPYIVRDDPVPGIVMLDSGGGRPLLGDPRFEQPQSLLVDRLGRLLMAHKEGVIRVGEDGVEETLLDSDRLDAILRIALGPFGRLFVTTNDERVVRVERDGELVELLDASGDGVNPLDFPDAITVDWRGNVYVTSRNTGSVFRVGRRGDVMRVLDPSAPLDQPGALVTDSAGNLYVAGVLSNNIIKRTRDGDVRELLNFDGLGDGIPFARPGQLVVDELDRVYTLSNRGIVYRIHPDERVEVFRDPGDLIQAPRIPGGPGIDALGNAYVTEVLRHQGFQYPADGGALPLFDFDPGPSSVILSRILVDPLGSLYVASRRPLQGVFHYEVFRVDPPCREQDTVPEIRRVLPREPRAGGLALLLGDGFQTEARAFFDRRLLESRVLSPRFMLARLPRDAAPDGDGDLQLVNPASCRSDPLAVRVRSRRHRRH